MTPLPSVRRRSLAERRALALLRGENMPSPAIEAGRSNRARPALGLKPAHRRYFVDLRRLAEQHGLTVQPPATPFISVEEMTLLSWLAEAQRISYSDCARDDPRLVAAVARCAGMLDGIGLRLSPLTLYGARLRATERRVGS